MTNTTGLSQLMHQMKIKVHEPFAEFLGATPEEVDFEISLLECYRLSGHACHAITGIFLLTKEAVRLLYPETNTCMRGDLKVQFGAALGEMAAGPKSNVIGFVTGAWGDTGFPGLKGRFARNHLVSFGPNDLAKNAVRFERISTGKSVTLVYDPSAVTSALSHGAEFPQSWRVEIQAILGESEKALSLMER
jgi:hypothetical protein